MFTKTAALAAVLSLTSTTLAAPQYTSSQSNGYSGSPSSGSGSYGGGSKATTTADLATYSPPADAPSYTISTFPTEVKPDGDKFEYPLSNNFPNITDPSDALNDIEEAAGGTLSNVAPPANISGNDSLDNLRLIAFNELFEVAFFTSLLENVTNHVDGFEAPPGLDLDFLIETLIAVQAQEELHVLNANGALTHFGADPIQPCEYVFPTTNLADAIALAQTFTDVVLGTLQDVATIFGENGDDALIRGIVSVVGQEGEQNGFYRILQGKRPSAEPFLTAATRDFAFSALNQMFVVPGSCPNIGEIDLTIFGELDIVGQPPTGDEKVTFSFAPNVTVPWGGKQGGSGHGGSGKGYDYSSSSVVKDKELNVVLLNGQNIFVLDIDDYKFSNGEVTFSINFPFSEDLLFGLTIVAVVEGSSFADVDAVEKAALFGPALIEID